MMDVHELREEGPVIVCGDPHGRYSSIVEECRGHLVPGTLILLGDQDLESPLQTVLSELYTTGWQIRFILGNHDTDRADYYSNLVSSLAVQDGYIGGRITTIGGLRIGAISGVFRGKVWYPKEVTELPLHPSREIYMRSVRVPERWRLTTTDPEIEILRGMPLKIRDAIFPEDLHGMDGPCDIMISHEAPCCRTMGDKGFGVLNMLADRLGVRLWLHGHHHHSYEELVELPSGRSMTIRGLGIRECYELQQPRKEA